MSDDIPIYEIPIILLLNKHPSLNITMIVTAPRPPLLTSAGILGVLGEKPGKSDPYMIIRPEGDWDRPGVLDFSAERSVTSPLRNMEMAET